MDLSKISVVIPAMNPAQKFIEYIKQLKEIGFTHIVVVNDGSEEIYETVFNKLEQEGVIVLHHGINCGKGRALKTAFNFIMVKCKEINTIVTADCDSTYLPEDILNVSAHAQENFITLGQRDYSSNDISDGSRRANIITYYLLKLLSGIEMNDTQTGLRAYPRNLLPYLLKTPGEGYDYEFNMIFEKKKIQLNEISIHTTRQMYNPKTHFKALKDTWSITRAFLLFIFVSLSSTILDLILYNFFIIMFEASMPLLYISVATILARVASDTYNYFLDKTLVFEANETSHFGRYVLLAIIKTILSAVLVSGAVFLLKGGELSIKLVVDTLIFFLGYRIEKSWVYEK